MPTINQVPPPPSQQPIAHTQIPSQSGTQDGKGVVDSSWAQWFALLQLAINGTPVPPPFPGIGGANDLLGMNAAGTDFEYKALGGTANEIGFSFTPGVITAALLGPHAFTTQTNHGLLIGRGTGAIVALGVATNGQIPIGSTGVDPVLATLTAGSGVTITNSAGSITIAASGGNIRRIALATILSGSFFV